MRESPPCPCSIAAVKSFTSAGFSFALCETGASALIYLCEACCDQSTELSPSYLEEYVLSQIFQWDLLPAHILVSHKVTMTVLLALKMFFLFCFPLFFSSWGWPLLMVHFSAAYGFGSDWWCYETWYSYLSSAKLFKLLIRCELSYLNCWFSSPYQAAR